MINEGQLKKIITDSFEPSDENKKNLKEAYSLQPKSYTQVSDLVSQRTKDSHLHLYHDYINNLNKLSVEIDASSKTDQNSKQYEFRSLKINEAYNLNSVALHEAYFANCFDPNSELYMDTLSYMRLQRDFGTIESWQTNFLTCAINSNGWVVCGYNTFLKRFVNTIVNENSQDVMVGLIPAIVIDCHEHAYFRDYLNDKKNFILAQMKEFNWEVIEERFRKLDKIHEVLK